MHTSKERNKKVDHRDNYRIFIKWFWGLFTGILIFISLLFLFASWGFFGKMPTFEDLENPRFDLAAQIISSDGAQLGTIFRPNENRTPIRYKDLPTHLIEALVATEDVRFYKHSGIDARGTLRAFLYLGKRGGASTITQQLAKLLFHGQRIKGWKGYFQKIKEWVIATRLERQYTKSEIITMYLNKYDFAYQAIGIRSASRIYFAKEPTYLTVQEAAVLVGMLKSATAYNPRLKKEKAKDRRNTVLGQMAKYGYLTEKEKDSLIRLPMQLHFTPEGYSQGIATYFRKHVESWMDQWILKNPKGKEDNGELVYFDKYRDGLKIYTTLNSRMQRHAEDAVSQHMKNLQKEFDKQEKSNRTAPFRGISDQEISAVINQAMQSSERWKKLTEQGENEKEILDSFHKKTRMKLFSWDGEIDTLMTPKDSIRYYKSILHAGLLSIEPQNGYVRAWVGGINHKYFQQDHVSKSSRQVGSTFKPFVYVTAIDQLKVSPCYQVPKSRITIPVGKHGVSGEDWTPENTDNDYVGSLTLKEALAGSVNTISAKLIDRIGPESVLRLIKKLGVESPIDTVASISLGAAELKLSEMVGAYSTFANKGVYTNPVIITHIEDKNGTLLYESVSEQKDVMSEEVAYVALDLMQGVTETGSGKRLRTMKTDDSEFTDVITGYPYGFTNPIAGKTGTSQNQSDGWFMGIVPDLCTGVWVGGENRATHFESITYGQGATMALPIWALFMEKCYSDSTLKVSEEAFAVPDSLSIEIDCERYAKLKNSDNQDADELQLRP